MEPWVLNSKGRAEPILSLTVPVTAAYPSLDSAAGKLECPPIRKMTPELRGHPTPHHQNGKTVLDVTSLEVLTLLLISMCGSNGPTNQLNYHPDTFWDLSWPILISCCIYDLLKCTKGLVLLNNNHSVSMTHGNNMISERRFD